MTLINIIEIFIINLTIATMLRKKLTYKGLQVILIFFNFCLFCFCIYSWTYFIIKYGNESVSFKLNSNNWTNISYEISLKINSLNFLFVLLVTIIGFATNIYILNYFKYEERSEEFILLINWFILSMIFLVISNNFFTLMIGWELIGLTSFLLINFWKFKVTTLNCSFKAFVFNKISDMFLMISFCLLWNLYGIDNIDTLLNHIVLNPINNNYTLHYSCICLIISSGIKSAQIIGHLWLPDSMEAPVPASSLIHSATLVSAGIYLILKFQSLFIYTNLLHIIFFIGSVTACYGGVVASSQSDMKKLLAYSTISHCGFIFASISLNNILVTVVYLYLHGLFKALTFFTAGSIIKYNGSQDMRLMGMQKNQIFNCISLIIASTNLGGLPFTFGYLYKLLFLNYIIIQPISIFSYGFLIVGMVCSVIYVFKIVYYSCFDIRKGYLQVITLLLQNNMISLKEHIFSSSFFKMIAFSIVYIFSILFYFIIKMYILKNYIYFYSLPETQVNDYMFLNELIFAKSYLIKIYYILFITTIVTLLLWNWRTNYFFIEKQRLILHVSCLLIFYYISGKFLQFNLNFIHSSNIKIEYFINTYLYNVV